MSHHDINLLTLKWFSIPAQEENIIIAIFTFQICISNILVFGHLHDSEGSLSCEVFHFTCG